MRPLLGPSPIFLLKVHSAFQQSGLFLSIVKILQNFVDISKNYRGSSKLSSSLFLQASNKIKCCCTAAQVNVNGKY